MLDLAWYSTKLLLKGKLLRNPEYFYRQVSLGIISGISLLLVSEAIGINSLLAIIISSLVIGMAMPFLLKDVKLQ